VVLRRISDVTSRVAGMLYGKFSDSSPQHSHENAVIGGPRVLRDENTGDVTTVVERKANAIVGARASSCLIFHTDGGFVRLWEYPENWMDLPDGDLLALTEPPRRSRSA
jgi:hypothetical protein